MTPNIFASLRTTAPKIVAYLLRLDADGGIDRDDDGDPIVRAMEEVAPKTFKVVIERAGRRCNFVINVRKRPGADGVVEPIGRSWTDDGWKRNEPTAKIAAPPPGAERQRRALRFADWMRGGAS